jgi:hypothetical protein
MKAYDHESGHLDPEYEAVRDLALVLTSWKVAGTFPPFSPPPPAIYEHIHTYIHSRKPIKGKKIKVVPVLN